MNRELHGDTLVVRIPMRFKRQGRRKRILAPDGSDLAPPSRVQPDGTLVKALARAWRWQRQLHGGIYTSFAKIAAAEKLSPSYVSRIARLAPDIVEAILARTLNQGVILDHLENGVPVEWEEQRANRRISLIANSLPEYCKTMKRKPGPLPYPSADWAGAILSYGYTISPALQHALNRCWRITMLVRRIKRTGGERCHAVNW